MRRKMSLYLAVLLLVVGTSTVYAQNSAIQFEAFDFACETGNIILSEEPLIAGTSVVVPTFIDDRRFLVDATDFPTVFPGSTWVAPGHGQLLPNGFVAHHAGFGTGELEGGMIKYKVTPTDVAPPPDCNLVGPAVLLDGVIIFPPGHTP